MIVCNLLVVVTFFYLKFRNAEDIEAVEDNNNNTSHQEKTRNLVENTADLSFPSSTLTLTEISTFPSSRHHHLVSSS